MSKKQALLQNYLMGDLALPNRIVMAPLTRCRADNEELAPTALHAEYYAQRASAGFIISEGVPVSTQASGYLNVPGIYTTAQTEAWKLVTKAVHDKNGRIFIQLWHVGRMSHPDYHGGELPVAPSAISAGGRVRTPKGIKEKVAPRALTVAEIKQTIQDFVQGAKNALYAGFDGVEIHSSNGYLFHQFFSTCSNIRTDEYGGSIENRSRIFFELLDELKKIMPLNRVGVRLNPSLHTGMGIQVNKDTLPTFDYIIQRLNDYDLAYLHLSEPYYPVDDVPFAEPNVTKRYRPIYKGTLITNTRFTQVTGNQIIEDGLADLVAYGVPFIANPDLPERFAQNAPLNEPDKSTFYTTGAKGYTDYPFLVKENSSRENS